jgi:hypothetical protein
MVHRHNLNSSSSCRRRCPAINLSLSTRTTSDTIVPLPPPAPLGINRPTVVNPLAIPTHTGNNNHNGMEVQTGRFVPHVVTISLDTTSVHHSWKRSTFQLYPKDHPPCPELRSSWACNCDNIIILILIILP